MWKFRTKAPNQVESSEMNAGAADTNVNLEDHDIYLPPLPHEERVMNRNDGPYYIAPDSTEPLPEGMWSRLDPATVVTKATAEQQDMSNADNLNRESCTSGVPSVFPILKRCHRKFLEDEGPAGKRLLETLDRGMETWASPIEDQ